MGKNKTNARRDKSSPGIATYITLLQKQLLQTVKNIQNEENRTATVVLFFWLQGTPLIYSASLIGYTVASSTRLVVVPTLCTAAVSFANTALALSG